MIGNRRKYKEMSRIMAIVLSFVLVLSSFAMLGPVANAATAIHDGSEEIINSEKYKNFYTDGSEPTTFPDLTITGDEGEEMHGATVVINGYQSGDTVTIDIEGTGITIDTSKGNGVYILNGTASIETYQEILQNVEFTTTKVGERSITFGLGPVVSFSQNGHFYEFVDHGAGITWPDARETAEQRSYYGRQGYLATITSSEENAFIAEKAQGIGWIGGQDVDRVVDADGKATTLVNTLQGDMYNGYGDWRWVTGPEGEMSIDGQNGLPFYKGYTTNSDDDRLNVVDAVYGHGENSYMHSNWQANEPNDMTYESVVHIFANGQWNDYAVDNIGVSGGVKAYLVEYGGMPDDAATSISTTMTLVDKTPLKSTYNIASGYDDPQVYTQASLDALEPALEEAEAVLGDSNASPGEIEEALEALQTAVDGLVKLPPVAESANYTAGADNQISIVFDQAIKFNDTVSDPAGAFVITMDGMPVEITNAVVSAEDPKTIILTLARDFSNDPVVRIEYDDADTAIEPSDPQRAAVEDFTLIANGPFGGSLIITEPETDEPGEAIEFYGTDFPIVVSGVAAVDSTVTASVYNINSNPDEYLFDLDVDVEASDDINEWTSQLNGPLAPGAYHIAVTSTKMFGDEVKSETKLLPFTIPQLELIQVAVEDEHPDQAILTFNQAVDGLLDEAAFAGLTIDGRKVIAVESIGGNEVVVQLDDAFGPDNELVVEYDAVDGDIVADGNGLNVLLPIAADDQAGIAKNNAIIPLQLIAAYPEDGKLKLVFNKPIDDGADLTGFTYGGAPLEAPYEINGNELIVGFPADYEGNMLSYDPEQGNITEDDNANNLLTGLQPGIDLGDGAGYIADGGKLPSNGLGLANGEDNVPLTPSFQPNVPGGYKAVVPNDVESVGLNPAPVGNDGTLVKVSLNGVEVADGDWSKLPLQEGLNIIQVDIFDANQPNIQLGQYQLHVIRASGKLISLDPSTDELEPAFDSATIEYEMSVKNGVKEMQFKPVTLDPGATVSISLDGGDPVEVASGEWSEAFELHTGDNEIVFTVTDSAGKMTEYIVIVDRSSSSGGGHIPSPTEIIEVDVAIGGENPADITKVPIERTTNPDGTITDQVTFTEEKAKETVEKAKETGENIARVIIPDKEDEVSEVNVDVPFATTKLLQENGIDLEIYTENGIVRLPNSSLDGIGEDFYFRLVPVKDEEERNEIEERATIEQVVREIAGDSKIEVVARPMTIETNLSSRAVTLVLPLRDVELPEDAAEREAFLKQLGIFIEHSDGEKEVVKGEVVTYKDGLLGLQFTVTKFSTFTIINYNNQSFDSHEAYIVGFPDGEFKPDENVTRGQMALMIARNLGYESNGAANATPFEDVPANHYAADAIAYVEAQGIMDGYPNGEFRANAPITRAEMATVAANYLSLSVEEDGKTSFNDTKGHWAQAIIEANLTAGVIQGYPDESFRPNSNLSRAEAVSIVNKMFNRGPLYGVTENSFPDVADSHWAYEHIQEAATDHEYIIDEEQKEQIVK